MHGINILAVLVAAVSAFVLGGIWYSKLMFEKIWLAENGRTGELKEDGSGHPARVFGVSFVFALIAAYAFALWLGPEPNLMEGLHYGLLAGLGIAATSFGINYQFSGRSTKLWLIDGGYHTVQFVVYGLVLGLIN